MSETVCGGSDGDGQNGGENGRDGVDCGCGLSQRPWGEHSRGHFVRRRDRRTVVREGQRMENMGCRTALPGRMSMRDRERAGVWTGRSMST